MWQYSFSQTKAAKRAMRLGESEAREEEAEREREQAQAVWTTTNNSSDVLHGGTVSALYCMVRDAHLFSNTITAIEPRNCFRRAWWLLGTSPPLRKALVRMLRYSDS